MSATTFISYRRLVSSKVQEATDRALEICGGMAESYAKQLCPVDTGNLRNSITHQQYNSSTEIIGTAVEYAPHVELGTCKMNARPYLRPAVENHMEQYRSIFDRELGKIR